MMEDIKIERLKASDKPELLELFAEAFKDLSWIPSLFSKLEATRAARKAFLIFRRNERLPTLRD